MISARPPVTIRPPTGSRRGACRPAVGIANGTFGELLQGALPGADNDFLITFPIPLYSRAVFEPGPHASRLEVRPPTKVKALQLARNILDHFGSAVGGTLTVSSRLPEGKGMASSSADLVATAEALAKALGRSFSAEQIMSFLRAIEPTDGVMYSDFVAFFHRKVKLYRRLGYLPDLHVVAIDEGGQVDTIVYNETHNGFTACERREYERLLGRAVSAFHHRDLEALGRIATRSAIMNQRRNPKKFLAQVIDIGRRTRALGVVVTHSGPCIGLVFAAHDGGAAIGKINDAAGALQELTPAVFRLKTLGRSPRMRWPAVRTAAPP